MIEKGWVAVAALLGMGFGITVALIVACVIGMCRKGRRISPRHPAYRRRPPGGNEKWPTNE